MIRKIAIVHDQIKEFGGAERVLVALKKIYPEADVFTSFYEPLELGIHKHHFENWKIITSWADQIPFFSKLYSPLRFLAPKIWESFDFSKYDIVISSSGWYMCKGIITNAKTTHICYLHHPPRYLYGYETAVEWQKFWPIKIYANIVNHSLRTWDYLSSQRVNFFVANSHETEKRIEKFYRRDVTVIYPPVEIPKKPTDYLPRRQAGKLTPNSYFITTSRLAKAKHIEILITAANKAKFDLKVIGSGRDEQYLRSIAGETVEFLNNVPDEKFSEIYSNAKAFLFASVDEEFGIAPIEAMGYGIPVIAFSSGGLKETVEDGKNGYLYEELNDYSLIQAVRKLDKLPAGKYKKMRQNARTSAEKYSFENFKTQITKFVSSKTKK